jgi:hypothetical protein
LVSTLISSDFNPGSARIAVFTLVVIAVSSMTSAVLLAAALVLSAIFSVGGARLRSHLVGRSDRPSDQPFPASWACCTP